MLDQSDPSTAFRVASGGFAAYAFIALMWIIVDHILHRRTVHGPGGFEPAYVCEEDLIFERWGVVRLAFAFAAVIVGAGLAMG